MCCIRPSYEMNMLLTVVTAQINASRFCNHTSKPSSADTLVIHVQQLGHHVQQLHTLMKQIRPGTFPSGRLTRSVICSFH